MSDNQRPTQDGSDRWCGYEATMQTARSLLSKSVHPLAKPRDVAQLFKSDESGDSKSASSKQYASRMRVMAWLQTGNDRLDFRKLHGGHYDAKRTLEIDAVAAKFPAHDWAQLVDIFASLLRAYEEHVARPREIVRNARKVISQCRALAKLFEEFDASDLSAWGPEDGHMASTFHGLVARHILHRFWVQALEALPKAYTPAAAEEIAKYCVWNLYLSPPEKLLTGMLRDYANLLETFDFGTVTATLNNPSLTRGKLTEKEFVKRTTFVLLDGLRTKKGGRAPNKETAIVVNVILGLTGRRAVTANDISQMNKSTRRQYYKE